MFNHPLKLAKKRIFAAKEQYFMASILTGSKLLIFFLTEGDKSQASDLGTVVQGMG